MLIIPSSTNKPPILIKNCPIVTLKNVIQFMSDDEINVALSKQFNIKHADSFKHSNPCVKNVPLFTKCKSKYYSRYDFHNIKEIVS
jgi:hypothetical protein